MLDEGFRRVPRYRGDQMPRASVVRGAILGAALIVTMGGFFMPADVAATTADPAVFVRLRSGAAADALHVPAEVRWTGMPEIGRASCRERVL